MNHYTICHLSCYLSISHAVFHTFTQMLLLSEISPEMKSVWITFLAPEQKWFPVITLNLRVWSQHTHYLEFVNRENLLAALRSRSELCNSNSIMCLFEKWMMENWSGLGTPSMLAVFEASPFLRPEQITSGLRLKLMGSKIAFWYDPSATSHRNITVQHFTHNDDLIGVDYLVLYKEKLNWLNWSQQRRKAGKWSLSRGFLLDLENWFSLVNLVQAVKVVVHGGYGP